jgi:tellurium resistance protein TerZ
MAISLKKGQKISLKKSTGEGLKNFCVGVNWGMIVKKEKAGFFGKPLGKDEVVKKRDVDLDLSAFLFDENMNKIDLVYFGNLSAPGIKHSGDDLTGDEEADDADNEIITIDLDKVNPKTKYIIFTLNSYNAVRFDEIPYARIRLCEGKPDNIKNIFAKYKIENDDNFKGKLSMILGMLIKEADGWKFKALGTPTPAHKLGEIHKYIVENSKNLIN